MRVPKARALRHAAALAALALLAGCDGLVGDGTHSLSVSDGKVVVAGPPGFCIDPEASHPEATAPFILLGSCAAITGQQTTDTPTSRAVLTAAVSAGAAGGTVAGSERELTGFFRSAEGRKALSRSANAQTVRVMGISHVDGVMVIHARDTSAFPGQAVAPDYWRALFDLNGHIVALSVIAVPQAPFTDTAGLRLLEQFVSAVRGASPGGPPAAAAPTG